MSDHGVSLLSEHLSEALYQLNLARDRMRSEQIAHREAAAHALAEAERCIAHVIGLIAGAPS